MKKALSLLVLVSFFAAGCAGKKKKETKKDNKSMNIPLASADQDAKKGFFDDEVGAFVLGDDFQTQDNVAVAHNDQAVSWVAEQDNAKEFSPIYFDFDQANIRVDQQSKLNKNTRAAKNILAHGDKLVVEGHACNSAGSKAYNLVISEHRAQTVAQRLLQDGVDANNVKVVGRGTEMLIITEGDRDAQAVNRRVEMYGLQA